MYCTYCNFENDSTNKFCESCGKPLNDSLADTKPLSLKTSKNNYDKSMSGRQSKNKLNITSRFKIILAIFIGLALLTLGFMLFIDTPAKPIFPQEPTKMPPSIKLMPIDVFNSDGNKPGWQRLEVQTVIANSYSSFRIFVLDCAGVREISVTSSESRTEGVNWIFDSSCTIITLPPGMIIRTPSSIAGQIPLNMTNIQLKVPYSDLQMNSFPKGVVSSNNVATINLDTDFVDTGLTDFPVYDETLLDVHEIGDNFELAAAMVQVSTFAEFQDDKILAQIHLHNMNSLDNSQLDYIQIYGAGSDGVLRKAERVGKYGDQCQPPLVGNGVLTFILEKIGPGQTLICNIKFTNIPENLNNFHIWFTLYQHNGSKIIDYATFRLTP